MTISQNNLCIIPARGGSKRIPRKNIKDFLGKPIIAYSIDAALKSELFTEVMVSTDDEEIKDIAIRYGARVPFMRTQKNSNDFATTMDVLREVVGDYEKRGRHFQTLCCIYPTAPLVDNLVLKSSFELFVAKQFDTMFPVLKYGFPIQRSLHLEEGRIQFNWPENANRRSQDLDASYHDAGQFYWLRNTPTLQNSMVTANSGGYPISELDAQDIDDEVDWRLAELKYALRNEGISL